MVSEDLYSIFRVLDLLYNGVQNYPCLLCLTLIELVVLHIFVVSSHVK